MIDEFNVPAPSAETTEARKRAESFSYEHTAAVRESYDNSILNTDSYKMSHWKQYPPGAEKVYSYIESRGGEFDRLVFFGLQSFIKRYLMKPITKQDINLAEVLTKAHGLMFNRSGWEYILKVHGGRLPLSIKAVKEGTVVPPHIPLVTVENTDPNCAWVTSFGETPILRAVWYPSTVATVSYHAKIIIYKYLVDTCDNPDDQIAFKLHDFGYRGVSSKESGELGGLGHLINFMGTDTMGALAEAIVSYNATGPVGYSIPAAEHSTITSWGRDSEKAAYENMIDQFGGEGKMYAVVSDSYNIYNAVEHIWGEELKDKVLEKGGCLVVRPDSGNPADVVLQTINMLGSKFGFTVNRKGFKVLNAAVRVIQGDGINLNSIEEICLTLRANGWSIENIAFGMGGGLLQSVNRDTLKWAMKCSAICINGKWQDVYKDPITDPGKASKRGRFAVITDGNGYEVVNQDFNAWRDHLREVYRNGRLLIDDTFESIRARSRKAMPESKK